MFRCHDRNFYKYPVESKGVVALYLGAVSVQIIHLSEEYAFGFPVKFSVLFEAKDWSMHSFLMTFVFAGAALWVAAATCFSKSALQHA